MADENAEANAPEGPQDFVVVLAYTSTDGEIEEQFGQLVQDIKALYTFKNNMRAYAVVEESAKKVLAAVEKRPGGASNRATLVIAYDLPETVEEGHEYVREQLEKVRPLFEGQSNVEVHLAIKESADEVLDIFGGS